MGVTYNKDTQKFTWTETFVAGRAVAKDLKRAIERACMDLDVDMRVSEDPGFVEN